MSPIATAILITAVLASAYLISNALTYQLYLVKRSSLDQIADSIAEDVAYQLTQSINIASKREVVGPYNITLVIPEQLATPATTYRILLEPSGGSISITVTIEEYPGVTKSRRIYTSRLPHNIRVVGWDCEEGPVDVVEARCTIVSKKPRFTVVKLNP